MIITGKDAKETGIVEMCAWDGQFQPAGVDLSLESIYSFEGEGEIDGDNKKRRLPECKKIEFENSSIKLALGAYKIVFNEIVNVPEDVCAIARSRSSLLRMGAFVASAVWDPGYRGRSEALLVVQNPHGLIVHEKAKLAQIVFMRLEKKAHEKYSGQYQGENIILKDKGESDEERKILDSL